MSDWIEVKRACRKQPQSKATGKTTHFGIHLREARLAVGMSQRDLANAVGIDFTYISKLENGKMPPPSHRVIVCLAVVLGINQDELIAVGGKVPSDVAKLITLAPELAELVREASSLNLDGVRFLIAKIREAKTRRSRSAL